MGNLKCESMHGHASDNMDTKKYTTATPISPTTTFRHHPKPPTELSIFAADRYFNPPPDPKPHHIPTPSESSFNSHSNLLPSRKHHPSSFRRRRLLFSSCPCSGNASTDIVPNPVDKPKSDVGPTMPVQSKITNSGGFTFPILAKPTPTSDVFRPTPDRIVTCSRQRGLMFPAREDDAASDSSSDLFELESFSTGSNVLGRRDSLDEALEAGILQLRRGEEFHARRRSEVPSEVSVQWSVATAEEEEGRGRGLRLLGFRSERAVGFPVRWPVGRAPAREVAVRSQSERLSGRAVE